MEEAEVYGSGLERGKAMNLYVDDRLNHDTVKKTLHKTKSHKHNDHVSKEINIGLKEDLSRETSSVQIQQPMAFIAGDNSVRIQWSIEPKFHTKLLRIQSFSVEILQRQANEVARNGWKMVDHVQPHIRALTLRKLSLTPKNEYVKEFYFNIIN